MGVNIVAFATESYIRTSRTELECTHPDWGLDDPPVLVEELEPQMLSELVVRHHEGLEGRQKLHSCRDFALHVLKRSKSLLQKTSACHFPLHDRAASSHTGFVVSCIASLTFHPALVPKMVEG